MLFTSHIPVLAKITNSVSASILSDPTISSELLVGTVVPESEANMRTLGIRMAPAMG